MMSIESAAITYIGKHKSIETKFFGFLDYSGKKKETIK